MVECPYIHYGGGRVRIESIGSSSKGNCHYVEMGGTRFLLDAGISMREIQKGLGFSTTSLDGILLTHEHGDHSKAIKPLMSAGIDVYASRGTFQALGIEHYRANPVKAGERFKMGNVDVLPLMAIHDAAEPMVYIIDGGGARLFYVTDTYYVKYNVKGVTHLIVECNYSMDILRSADTNNVLKRRVMKSHMSIETVEKMINGMDKSSLQHVYLTHLSDNHSDEQQFRERVQRLTGVEVDVFSA